MYPDKESNQTNTMLYLVKAAAPSTAEKNRALVDIRTVQCGEGNSPPTPS